ncbi:adenosine deaminase [Didymella exigua CBS 183.55]|uniref:Adenine deaminase n=1 Tax=Didymella exigua CBS 183.55 TaxID=1150837 RepID=A0A6A5RQ98_9PLEO|nr:adenosine deaminase [Didymella exigua CBS 183.55]KAF1929839.1 adenosine deaminase [Didymella exigua CBS 183.55]
MCQTSFHEFLAELPKCEHHLHLEGCLSPSLTFKLAAKNNIKLPSKEEKPEYESIQTLEKRYEHFDNLQDFLDCYYLALDAVITKKDFEMLGWEYFTTAHADGVKHAELFFDPQSHTVRGIAFETVVAGFNAACERAKNELGISSRLIMCFLRHLPASSAEETMQSAIDGGFFKPQQGKDRIIAGLGLDSSEVGFRPELFKEQYAKGKELELHRTAHGGEEGDPSYISGALDSLHCERIDHGIKLVQDPELLKRIVEEEILLTICPLSNVCLQAVKEVGEVPIRKFLQDGVKFSINSDDPAYFGGYILKNYCAVQTAFNLSKDEWKIIVSNSINGSWVEKQRKHELHAMLEECLKKHA